MRPSIPDRQELRAALDAANVPVLLAVLRHLSGDPRWNQDDVQPTRAVALDDNDTAGLPEATRAEIRDAVADLVCSLDPIEVPPPPMGQSLIDLVSFSLGEPVPPEYAPSMEEEAGFRDRLDATWSTRRPGTADELDVLIIGAGLSGVAAAVQLERLGVPYEIVERSAGFGGVWFDNDYPGAGSDTPIHLYSFSFAPHPLWSRYYARQPEIRTYIERTADQHGVTSRVRFGEEVLSACWDEDADRWEVRSRDADGERVRRPRVLISCVGILNQPRIPDLPGMDQFAGPMFHSSRWDHEAPLDGARVALIGTGATSMQILPAIVDRAQHVTVFQRTPQWVVPNPNYLRDVAPELRMVMRYVPYYLALYRLRLIWMSQDKLLPTLRRDPAWAGQPHSINADNEKHRRFLTGYLDGQLGDRTDLRPKVLPEYPPYGKRMLMDNGWFQTIKRDDVSLVTTPVTGFHEHQVVTEDGGLHEADVAVLATGFHSARMLHPMDIRGRDGRSIRDLWGEEDPFAHLGITVPGFPNFFLLGGPNTQLGHGGSAIFVSECAASYIGKLLVRMVEDGLDAVDVREEVCHEYNARVAAEHDQLIWTHPGAVRNWFRNSRGRVVAVTPWRGVDYWKLTREPALDDFHLKVRTESRRSPA